MRNVLFAVLNKELTMDKYLRVGHVKIRLMMAMLSLALVAVTAGQSLAATTCITCHGMPPLDSKTGQRNSTTGAILGNHSTHVKRNAAASDCVRCHNTSPGNLNGNPAS